MSSVHSIGKFVQKKQETLSSFSFLSLYRFYSIVVSSRLEEAVSNVMHKFKLYRKRENEIKRKKNERTFGICMKSFRILDLLIDIICM